ncbi:MAG: hypothetical protein WBF17_02040 [Phycisphaerae bacterium]
MAELLTVASPSGSPREEPLEAPDVRRFLEDRLAASLPLEPDVVDSVTALLNRPCHELLPLAKRPLGDVLTDAATSLDVLKTLRDYGRALALRWEEGPESAVAMTTYYAAIAAALTCYGQKITSRPSADLARAMELLASTPWMTQPMITLFSEALRLCREA